jgi:hypothetical protein
MTTGSSKTKFSLGRTTKMSSKVVLFFRATDDKFLVTSNPNQKLILFWILVFLMDIHISNNYLCHFNLVFPDVE